MKLSLAAGVYPFYDSMELCIPETIVLSEGIWHLVGANGSGKSTTMREFILPLVDTRVAGNTRAKGAGNARDAVVAGGIRAKHDKRTAGESLVLYSPQDMRAMVYAKLARSLKRDMHEPLIEVLRYFVEETEAIAAPREGTAPGIFYLLDEPPLGALDLIPTDTHIPRIVCIISHDELGVHEKRLAGCLRFTRIDATRVELRKEVL